MRGLITAPPTIMGKNIVPVARAVPPQQQPTLKMERLGTCTRYGGVTTTEQRKCCGDKITNVHFFMCTLDNQEREYRVCLFCPHYKERTNDSGNKGPQADVPGVVQQA